MKSHKVKEGDCLASITKQYGFHDPDVIYSDAANTSLKSTRKNMYVLNPNDVVKIPEKETKSTELAIEATASFKVKGIVSQFKIIVEDFAGAALANKDYELAIEGIKFEGKTDGTGLIEHKIDASDMNGELTVYLDDTKKNNICWPLKLGCMTPHDEVSGVQSRLNNLGYFCKNEKGNEDKTTKAAVNAFKKANGLPDDDIINQATSDKLQTIYGF